MPPPLLPVRSWRCSWWSWMANKLLSCFCFNQVSQITTTSEYESTSTLNWSIACGLARLVGLSIMNVGNWVAGLVDLLSRVRFSVQSIRTADRVGSVRTLTHLAIAVSSDVVWREDWMTGMWNTWLSSSCVLLANSIDETLQASLWCTVFDCTLHRGRPAQQPLRWRPIPKRSVDWRIVIISRGRSTKWRRYRSRKFLV